MFEAMPLTRGGRASRNQKGLTGKAEPFRTVRRQSRKRETRNSKLRLVLALPRFLRTLQFMILSWLAITFKRDGCHQRRRYPG
jgi:hypothetical protein